MADLILASTSPYRRELLSRFRVPFEVEAPGIDESPRSGESPADLAVRLGEEKALAVARRHPQSWVVGSDQVADLDGQALGKPGGHAAAVAQLRLLSGRRSSFHTAVTVAHWASRHVESALVTVHVQFRSLSSADIETYLQLEQPYDCAGSAKCESLGITLVDAIESEDPTALIGLPLIATARLLREAGFDPLRFRGLERRAR